MINFKLKPKIVFMGLAVFLLCGQPYVFCETSSPHTARSGGLRDDEVISMNALRQKQLNHDRFLLIDARGKKSFNEGHIEGAVLSLTEEYYRQEELFRQGIIPQPPDADRSLAEAMSRYPKNTQAVTYCNNNCQASAVLLFKIKKLGFNDVKAMEEGFQSWEKKNYPVTKISRP